MSSTSGFIYNTGLSSASTQAKLLVDSATLITLAQANQLDLLLQTGRSVVITSTVQGEAASNPAQFPNDAKIAAWIAANEQSGRVYVDNNPNYPTTGSDRGEISMSQYVSNNAQQDIRIVSGDAQFINNGVPGVGLPPGRDLAGTSGVTVTPYQLHN